MIAVVGGVYEEIIMHPFFHEVYGSGGRAATALAKLSEQITLYTYVAKNTCGQIQTRAALDKFEVVAKEVNKSPSFYYDHGLAEPRITNEKDAVDCIYVQSDNIVQFGMLEGQAKVNCIKAVYDPQNVANPTFFSNSGSKAEHLAVIINKYELDTLTGLKNDIELEKRAIKLKEIEKADVVVVKMGAQGALVVANDAITYVSAFKSDNVLKIGSGDIFTAHFSAHWFKDGDAVNAAEKASKAVSYYCNTGVMPSAIDLVNYDPDPIIVSDDFRSGKIPKVYLAGPFFSLAQIWQIQQARENLLSMGLRVFSPYHDVGRGSAEEVVQKDINAIHESDLIFAVGDGFDPGTIFEIGYARAIGKPVIIYSENQPEGDVKMMVGTDCRYCLDYVTAIYKVLWKAVGI